MAQTASALSSDKILEDLLILALGVADPQMDPQPVRSFVFPNQPAFITLPDDMSTSKPRAAPVLLQ
jgi:hypothetical protein